MRTSVLGFASLLGGTILSNAAMAQCPPVNDDTGCGAVITVDQNGATIQQTGMGPYDGSDDTLIGVVNNIPACTGAKSQTACGISIYSLDLMSANMIFAFDGDGINTYGIQGNAMDNTGYGGPNAYFTNYSSGTSGRVNFITPIPPGGTAYFSLENVLTASTSCSALLQNSLHGATGAGFTPAAVGNAPNSVPFGGLPTVGIRATFVPTSPPGQAYTRAQAAQLCGFIDFDWQQTITQWPSPSNLFSNCALKDASGNPIPQVAPPAFNDQPNCGYTYTQPYYNPLNTYYNFYQGGSFGLASYETANQLSFFDAPNDPLLPAGQTLNFTTELVGLNGLGPIYSVVRTGILFTWTSNHKGATGGTTVTAVDPTQPIDTSGTGGATVVSVSQTPTYNGVSVSAINGSNNIFAPTNLVAAVLPASRSVAVNGTATAFATIINAGTTTATACSIAPTSTLPLTFHYQTTNPSTNALTGKVDTPVDIAAGASQTFVIALTPTAVIDPTNATFAFGFCTGTAPAPVVIGLNTLLLSGSTSPTPDVVALSATATNDGILHVPGSSGTGAFATATVNVGTGDTITASANTGSATLPLALTICQTNPQNGQCQAAPAATVTTTINPNATPTFSIFGTASGTIPFDPANSRIFVVFSDSSNAVRGETSVAVETQ
jgi:hypothetical protein